MISMAMPKAAISMTIASMLKAVFLCYNSVGGYRLKGYIGERKGEREDMQDAHTIIDDFTPQFSSLPNDM